MYVYAKFTYYLQKESDWVYGNVNWTLNETSKPPTTHKKLLFDKKKEYMMIIHHNKRQYTYFVNNVDWIYVCVEFKVNVYDENFIKQDLKFDNLCIVVNSTIQCLHNAQDFVQTSYTN